MSRDELAVIRNRKIGFVFQGFNLLSRTTALDNVELPLLYNGAKLKIGPAPAGDGGAEDGQPGGPLAPLPQPALGRTAAARRDRARAGQHPTILLADEPTGNLDTRTSIEVMDIFQKLNADRGITVLLITHETTSPSTARGWSASGTGRSSGGRDQIATPAPAAAEEELAGPDAVPPSTEEGLTCRFVMTLRIALKALNRNKMRTMLTMLGMIIGVGAVITMVALGKGAQSIEEQIKAAGTNMIMVNAGNFTSGGVRHGPGACRTR
jgi:macrolide transport system ATP-binding/permease protein